MNRNNVTSRGMDNRVPELMKKVAVFLLRKCGSGPTDAVSRLGRDFLLALSGKKDDNAIAEPFKSKVDRVYQEIGRVFHSERREEFENLYRVLDSEDDEKIQNAVWRAFFPEVSEVSMKDYKSQILELRNSRTVKILQPHPKPISNPSQEIIFTSNVLLCPPDVDLINSKTGTERELISRAMKAYNESQMYWYDHPIPIGTPRESNEVIYGLKGLANTLRFEKERGAARKEERLTVLLSVSVTHKSLHDCALEWLRFEIENLAPGDLEGLDVYAFTEIAARKIIEIIRPWLDNQTDFESLGKTFGVDGEYGKHYSFLKAMPALFAILNKPSAEAAFKIDLDHVFPQEELVQETGKSAFEHFCTPLWGARAEDKEGKSIELGMIAGGLVNESDIVNGLFTPDIKWPDKKLTPEELIFFKQLPMAVSTRAELMCNYGQSDSPDGIHEAIQRIHVTGGTTGLRLDALRKYRPFCPSFIGRAEDQSYILSLLDESVPSLRYVHLSGLFMRHDKMAFTTGTVKAGKAGSYIGDLQRILIFSYYAGWLPGGQKCVKELLNPFTGCFITPIPETLLLLKLALHLISSQDEESLEARQEVVDLYLMRIKPWLEPGNSKQEELQQEWKKERSNWNNYYNALDALEKAVAEHDVQAETAREDFRAFLESTKITTGQDVLK